MVFPEFNGSWHWKKIENNADWSGKSLVYAFRQETLSKYRTIMNSKLWLESGIKSLSERKIIRRDFADSAEGVLISDGYHLDNEAGFGIIDRIFLADVPFSRHEMQLLLDQIENPEQVSIYPLYSLSDIEYNNVRAETLCPDKNSMKHVFWRLNQLGRKGLTGDVDEICYRWKIEGFELTPDTLLSVVNILKDLGLCSFNKKGKVIDIELLPSSGLVIDVGNSPYYLEGIADRRAWLDWSSFIDRL